MSVRFRTRVAAGVRARAAGRPVGSTETRAYAPARRLLGSRTVHTTLADMRSHCFRFPLLACLAFALAPLAVAHAGSCPDTASYEGAREIVADLGRIMSPEGVDALYTAPIGGVDHWISVRGQDRDNPMILFVHGGPASPLIPTLWQFQRPVEEYFTVANYDQRGAGKTFGETSTRSMPTV